jgi:hypothetical protein
MLALNMKRLLSCVIFLLAMGACGSLPPVTIESRSVQGGTTVCNEDFAVVLVRDMNIQDVLVEPKNSETVEALASLLKSKPAEVSQYLGTGIEMVVRYQMKHYIIRSTTKQPQLYEFTVWQCKSV